MHVRLQQTLFALILAAAISANGQPQPAAAAAQSDPARFAAEIEVPSVLR